MVGVNAKRFKPSVAAVKERYFAKFRGGKDAANDQGGLSNVRMSLE